MDPLCVLCNDPTPSPSLMLSLTLMTNCRISCCSPTELSAIQKTADLQDHLGLGSNKPSVLMDQLMALKMVSLDNVFLKMP
jgi:hypothetical protein